jgi:hypothetical protein
LRELLLVPPADDPGHGYKVESRVTASLTLNLTPQVRTTLVNLLTIAGRLEDHARIIDHYSDDLYGDLNEFQRSVYVPLRDNRSVAEGPGDTFTLTIKDARLIFDVLKGIDDGWVGGTPWKAMNPAERSAVDYFLQALNHPEK